MPASRTAAAPPPPFGPPPICAHLRPSVPTCAHLRPIQPPLASILTNSTWTALPFPPRACIPYRRTSPAPLRPRAHLRPSVPTCAHLRPPASHPTAPSQHSDKQYLDSLTFPSPCLHPAPPHLSRPPPPTCAHLRLPAPTCPYLPPSAPTCAYLRLPASHPSAPCQPSDTHSTWTVLPFPPAPTSLPTAPITSPPPSPPPPLREPKSGRKDLPKATNFEHLCSPQSKSFQNVLL